MTPHDGTGEAFRSLVEYIDPVLVAEDRDLSKEAVDRVMIRSQDQLRAAADRYISQRVASLRE